MLVVFFRKIQLWIYWQCQHSRMIKIWRAGGKWKQHQSLSTLFPVSRKVLLFVQPRAGSTGVLGTPSSRGCWAAVLRRLLGNKSHWGRHWLEKAQNSVLRSTAHNMEPWNMVHKTICIWLIDIRIGRNRWFLMRYVEHLSIWSGQKNVAPRTTIISCGSSDLHTNERYEQIVDLVKERLFQKNSLIISSRHVSLNCRGNTAALI